MEKRKDLSIREVISTNQQFFQALQKDAQEIVAHEKEKMQKLRLPLPLAYADFQSLFCEFGTICLHNRNQGKDFVFDKNNELIIDVAIIGSPSSNLDFKIVNAELNEYVAFVAIIDSPSSKLDCKTYSA